MYQPNITSKCDQYANARQIAAQFGEYCTEITMGITSTLEPQCFRQNDTFLAPYHKLTDQVKMDALKIFSQAAKMFLENAVINAQLAVVCSSIKVDQCVQNPTTECLEEVKKDLANDQVMLRKIDTITKNMEQDLQQKTREMETECRQQAQAKLAKCHDQLQLAEYYLDFGTFLTGKASEAITGKTYEGLSVLSSAEFSIRYAMARVYSNQPVSHWSLAVSRWYRDAASDFLDSVVPTIDRSMSCTVAFAHQCANVECLEETKPILKRSEELLDRFHRKMGSPANI